MSKAASLANAHSNQMHKHFDSSAFLGNRSRNKHRKRQLKLKASKLFVYKVVKHTHPHYTYPMMKILFAVAAGFALAVRAENLVIKQEVAAAASGEVEADTVEAEAAKEKSLEARPCPIPSPCGPCYTPQWHGLGNDNCTPYPTLWDDSWFAGCTSAQAPCPLPCPPPSRRRPYIPPACPEPLPPIPPCTLPCPRNYDQLPCYYQPYAGCGKPACNQCQYIPRSNIGAAPQYQIYQEQAELQHGVQAAPAPRPNHYVAGYSPCGPSPCNRQAENGAVVY